MYGSMKNKQVKAHSVEGSRPLGQAVSLGRLSSDLRVTTDRQSATWGARALGRGARSKNQRHSPIRLGSWKSLWKRCGCMRLARSKVEEQRYSISRGFWTKV